MKKIMFTNEGLDLRGIIEGLKSATVEGADLCVRPGYPVNPENIFTALPEAAKAFADEGLVIPLVTAAGDFTRPDIDYAEEYYALPVRGTDRDGARHRSGLSLCPGL